MSDTSSEVVRNLAAIRRTLVWSAVAIIAVILAVTNPSEADLTARLLADGWVPTNVQRANLLLFSVNEVTGFTGVKGVYIGIGGHYFGGEE